MYVLRDSLVETFYVYFERVKKRVAFFYLGMDLSLLDMLKVVYGSKLVEDTYDPLSVDPITSSIKDAQVELEGDKVMEKTNSKVTHQGVTSKENKASEIGQWVRGSFLFLFGFVITSLADLFNCPQGFFM